MDQISSGQLIVKLECSKIKVQRQEANCAGRETFICDFPIEGKPDCANDNKWPVKKVPEHNANSSIELRSILNSNDIKHEPKSQGKENKKNYTDLQLRVQY